MENEQLKKERRSNPLLDKSFAFAVSIVRFSRKLQLEKNEYVLSKQVLRSGTSIGALSEEAQQAESKADFIHKLSIANKEAHETHYWLRLIDESGFGFDGLKALIEEAEELKRLLIAIIKSSKSK